MGSRTWIKVYCDKWLGGTLREESPDVRGVWIDLLTLAGSGQYGDTGEVKLTNGIGFTDKQICEILRIQPALWRRAKERFLQTERIKISPKGAICITNWSKYQSEYNRQKPYRQPKEDTSTLEPESPFTNPLEIEKEIESRELQTEVTTESYNKKLQSRELSNNSLSLRGTTPPLRRHPPSLEGHDGTYRERITKYLKAHGPASIKTIAQATGIKANSVNLTLHKGKGKDFRHLKKQRAWDVPRDEGKP